MELARKKLLKKGDTIHFTINNENNKTVHTGIFEGFKKDGRVIINAAHDPAPIGDCDIELSVL